MNENEYLTIKEFSRQANVSQSAIYQQMNSRLKPYIIMVNGKRRILKEALEIFYSNSSQNISNSSQNKSNDEVCEVENISNSSQNVSHSSEVELMKSLVETLQKELDMKDKLLLEERQRVNDLNDKLAEAYKQIAEMGKASQYITAADKTIQLVEKQPVPEQPETPAATPEIIEPEKNRNFVSRILNWLNK